MNISVVGFGYLVPKYFYDHINTTIPELILFEGKESDFITFYQKCVFLNEFNGKSIEIKNEIAPNSDEMDLIKNIVETTDVPTLQLFTTVLDDRDIVLVRLQNLQHSESTENTFTNLTPKPDNFPIKVNAETILRQEQDEEYQLSLAIDMSLQDIPYNLSSDITKADITNTTNNNTINTKITTEKIDEGYPRILESINFDSTKDVGEQFKIIADNLINKTLLVAGKDRYQIKEIEFYYFNSVNHPDIFAHCDERQKEFGRWYFHRTGSGYRSGTFKGLDIVFGCSDYYGGILIRSIQNVDTNNLIVGPSCCVDSILNSTGYQEVKDLATSFDCTIWNKTNVLYLTSNDKQCNDRIYRSIRVGLSLKKYVKITEHVIKYLVAPYRYLIRTEPNSISKGRSNLIVQMLHDRYPIVEIIHISGSKRSTVIGFANRYLKGHKLDNVDVYAGKTLTSDDLSTICGWYSKHL
jgi:hypothetical protein